jgi:formate hydrogenlyase transcriptional activator
MSQAGHGFPDQRQVDAEDYRLWFNWNPQPTWVWDAETLRCLAANEAAIRHYGYSRDEFLAMTIEDIEPPEDASRLSQYLRGAPTGLDRAWVGKHREKDGAVIDVEVHSQRINWTGIPAHLVVAHDVTESKRAEQAMRNSEERVRLILDSAAEAIFGCDSEGTCLFCNRAAARLLGYDDPAELLGKNMHALEHHTRADGTPYPIEECPIYIGFQKGQGVHRDDEVYWRKDGTSFPVEFWSHPMVRDGRTLGAVITFIDITERKQAEEALRKSEERWRSVYENSAIGVALTDLNGRFLATNAAYQKMLGYTEEEFRKLTFLDITHEDHREYNWDLITELFEGKRNQFQIEKQYWRKDGSVIWVSNNVSLVPGTESMSRFIMALSEDITERKQAEEALRKSEERWRTLLEINNAIITNLTQEALLHAVTESLRRVIPFDRAGFSLYVPERKTFRLLATESEFSSDYFRVGLELRRGEGVSTWVFDHQQPVLRRDLEKEQQYPNDRRHLADGIYSYCVVPLIIRGKSIGTLNVGSRTRNQYSERDLEFLQEVASQVALAVENMQSYQEIAALKVRLEKENVYLQEEIRTEHNFEEIVGNSPALLVALRKVEQVAPTDSTVLIYGETGTGKELIARAIHNRSARKDRPLVKVNCSAISAGLVESELFGHIKGAFTGALERRSGRFELADGGTIFLDEIGELPLETQVKLLRVLQEREFEPVGSSQPVRVNVRVIAATNRNLEESIKTGSFRDDLFYRLNVFPVEVPPLRERRSDISKLATFFVFHYSKKLGKNIEGISQDTMDRISGYSWPGNVRELQNIIERAVILCQQPILELQPDLAPISARGVLPQAPEGSSKSEPALYSPPALSTLKDVERGHIMAVLKQTGGVIEGPNGAARILNLHPNTLRHRMSRLGIKRSTHRIS